MTITTQTQTRMRNMARRLLTAGKSHENTYIYLAAYWGVDERAAQAAVIDVSYPGGFEAWQMPPTDDPAEDLLS